MKIVLIVVGALVLATVGTVFLAGPQIASTLERFRPEPAVIEVRVQEIERELLVESVAAPGEIEPRTKVEISAEVSARIESLPFREGDGVKKGDIVVKLDSTDLEAALESAKAGLEADKSRMEAEKSTLTGQLATLGNAEKELGRKQTLFETGDISRTELDAAQTVVDEAKARAEAAKHSISVIESSLVADQANIDRAKQALNKTTIRAPMDGLITQLNAEVGEVVMVGTMNNPGTVILTIADLSRMLLNAQIAESDIARVSEGQPAKLYINAYPDEVFTGVVQHVAHQRTGAADGTGYFEAEVDIHLPDGVQIRSGLLANVEIEIARHEGLVIESQGIVDALLEDVPDAMRDNPLMDTRRKTTPVVFRIVDGKATMTPINVGPSDATHTLIHEGPEGGEAVIVGPYKVLESLKHEDRVIDEREAAEQRLKQKEPKPGDAGGGASVGIEL